MTTPESRYDLPSGRQSRLWSSRLWILAALLGVLTAVHVVSIVHDDRAWRSALHATAQATAEQHAERINERLQFLAAETFSPVTRVGAMPRTDGADLERLAQAQLASEECRCRSTLPVAEFFRVDVPDVMRATNATRRMSGGKYAAASDLADSVIVSIARNDATRPIARTQRLIHLTLDPSLNGKAVATIVLADSTSRSTTVYGLVASAHMLMQSLFTVVVASTVSDSPHAPSRLDTMSLQVGLNDSSPLFGKLSGDRPFRAKVFLHGPMDGLGVTVGLSRAQVQATQMGPPVDRLWATGALSLLTILVIAIAVGTSRRETFLARARSDFIAGTSHDFRMPLAQILLASETLNLRPEVSADQRNNLTKSIVRETQRLIGMVENVLLFSRSGAVEIKPTLHSLTVADVFDEVRDAVHLAVEDKRQTIVANADAELKVLADRELLRQALVNLIDNAMKYGADGQTITLSAARAAGGLIHISVNDQGPGIPEAQRARIFEPYERLTRDQATDRAGSGLGLAVVAQIAKACRGKVWVENAPVHGARFVLALTEAAS